MHVSYRYAVLSDLAYLSTVAAVAERMPTAASGFDYQTPFLFVNSQFINGSLSGFTAASSNFAVTVFEKAGQYVIAFRGSDSRPDILNGAGIGFGNYNDQVRDAIEFVRAFMAQVSSNVVLTGHSLGGALAGVAGSYFGLASYSIAPAPFGTTATKAAAGGETVITLDPLTSQPVETFVSYPTGPNATGTPNFSNAFIYRIEGEVAGNGLPSPWGGQVTTWARPNGFSNDLNFLNWLNLGDPVLHNAALHATVSYGEGYGQTWKAVDRFLYLIQSEPNALYADGRGQTLPENWTLWHQFVDKLNMRLGHDTGALDSLFNDMNDLGARTPAGGLLGAQAVRDALSKIAIQFSARLVGQPTLEDRDGVLDFNATSITIDLHEATTWSGIANGIVAKPELVTSVFTQSGWNPSQSRQSVELGLQSLGRPALKDAFDRAVFEANGGAGVTFVGEANRNDLLVGGTGADTLDGRGGDDILLGGGQNDTLIGGRGNDVLMGGADADTFKGYDSPPEGDSTAKGHEGNDWIDGGLGIDTVDYSGVSGAVTVSLVQNAQIPIKNNFKVDNDGTGGQDTLLGIEKLKLSNQNDTVNLTKDSYKVLITHQLREIDGAGNTGGDGDVIKADGFQNLKLVNGKLSGYDLTFKNFETLLDGNKAIRLTLLDPDIKKIDTAGGDDVVRSSARFATIDLGAGNDVLEGAGEGSVVYGRAGADRFELSENVLFADVSAEDFITYNGKILTGGIRSAASELPWAKGRFGLKYAMDTAGELVIRDNAGSQTFIANFSGTLGSAFQTAGIYIVELAIGAYRILEIPKGATIFGTWEALMGHALKALTGISYFNTVKRDPLVLDLDGDGIELSARSSISPYFDLDSDGFAEHAAWINGGDGVLARDLNGNGVIDNASELFGNEDVSGFAMLATLDGNLDGKVDGGDNGLADFNGDGIVDDEPEGPDTIAMLKVWRDGNEDGITDAGELLSLADLDIVSVSVTSTPTDPETEVAGNPITATASFTRGDGSTGTAADVHLRQDDFNTKWLGDSTVSAEAAGQPEVKGYGTLTNLRVAMTLDPDLVELVDETIAALDTTDLAALREAARPILVGWMNAVPLPAGAPGGTPRPDFDIVADFTPTGAHVLDFLVRFTDEEGTYWGLASGTDILDANGDPIERPTRAQVLAQVPEEGAWTVFNGTDLQFVERFLGDPIPLDVSNNPGPEAIEALTTVLDVAFSHLNEVVVRLAAQGPLAPFFRDIAYDVEADVFRPTSDRQIMPMLEAIFEATPETPAEASVYIAGWKNVLDVMLPDVERGESFLEVTYAYLFQNLVGAYENEPIVLSLQEAAGVLDIPADLIKSGAGTLTGADESELFYLDASNQTLIGNAGPDSYTVGRDFGHDVIQDVKQGFGDEDEDSIRFSHLNPEDLTFRRDGLDLVITQNGTDNEIRVVDEFAGRRAGLFGNGFIDPDRSIEVIVFADGTTWDKVDIALAAGILPDAAGETIVASPDVDFIDPGAGNDLIDGRAGGDLYAFGFGYGRDVIFDQSGDNPFDDTPDYVLFGAGVMLEHVRFSRLGDSDDMMVGLSDGSALIVHDQFTRQYTALGDFEFNKIEIFTFEDGIALSWSTIIDLLISDATSEGDDRIVGAFTDDLLGGGAGDDLLIGGAGNDSYFFGRDSGADTIRETPHDLFASDDDTVLFDPDLTADDIEWIFSGDDVIAHIAGTGDTLTVEHGLDPFFQQGVEQFVFDDGTVVTREDLIALHLQPSDGADTLVTSDGDDVLAGGLGNDVLVGAEGDDTYHFNPGDGQDVIDVPTGTPTSWCSAPGSRRPTCTCATSRTPPPRPAASWF